ncbi:hypothetical protein Tco_1452404, partial [Tanacetum coccineum]
MFEATSRKRFGFSKKTYSLLLSGLQSILKTEEFLKSNRRFGTCEDIAEDGTTASGCQRIGFDSTLNSRLSAPTPPRAMKFFHGRRYALDVVCSHPVDSSFEGALRFVVEFQKLQPDLVARSHLQ